MAHRGSGSANDVSAYDLASCGTKRFWHGSMAREVLYREVPKTKKGDGEMATVFGMVAAFVVMCLCAKRF